MIGKTNVGGGILKAYAYIVVQHPVGAAVSCTYSKKIMPLSADTDLILVADSASSCDVTATDGVQTATQTVSITSGESYYITLTFELYIVKNGIEQQGVEFTLGGRRYNNSTTGITTVNNLDHKSGFIKARAYTGGSSRGGAFFRSTTIKSLLGSYAYLNAKCQRYSTGSSNEYKLTLGTYYGDATNTVDNFLDSTTITHTSDNSVVTLQIPLTVNTTGAEDVLFATAFVASGSTSGDYGIDLYDLYLTNTELT